jgi:hypothetical protein
VGPVGSQVHGPAHAPILPLGGPPGRSRLISLARPFLDLGAGMGDSDYLDCAREIASFLGREQSR